MNNEAFASDPVFGFKRDLIRLIGNLCHKNKENQDLVFILTFFLHLVFTEVVVELFFAN